MLSYSIVVATYNKAPSLREVVASIAAQDMGDLSGEIIIVDDGSTDATEEMCLLELSDVVRYVRLNDAVGAYRNPAVARNVGYRMAAGKVIIAQSDDVVHADPNNVRRLVDDLEEGTFVIGTVYNVANGKHRGQYTGAQRQRPFFFLGALFRRDLYQVGGNDEDFKHPGFEDTWFGDCLIHGLRLKPIYHPGIIGHHLDHGRPQLVRYEECRRIYNAKITSGKFVSSGGPWKW